VSMRTTVRGIKAVDRAGRRSKRSPPICGRARALRRRNSRFSSWKPDGVDVDVNARDYKLISRLDDRRAADDKCRRRRKRVFTDVTFANDIGLPK
jgi:hypothetical protein